MATNDYDLRAAFGLQEEEDPRKPKSRDKNYVIVGDPYVRPGEGGGTSPADELYNKLIGQLGTNQTPDLTPPPEAPAIQGFQALPGINLRGRYASEEQRLQQQESDLGLQRRNQIAGIDEDYTRAQSQGASMQELAQKQLREAMASRGLFRSGINLQENARVDTEFGRFFDDLAHKRARGVGSIESSYAQGLNNLYRTREGLYGAQAEEDRIAALEEQRRAAEAAAAQQLAEQQQAALAALAEQTRLLSQPQQIVVQPGPSYSMPVPSGYGSAGVNYNGTAGGIDAGAAGGINGLIQMPKWVNDSSLKESETWIASNINPAVNWYPPVRQAVVNAFNANPNGLTPQQINDIVQQAMASMSAPKPVSRGGGGGAGRLV